MKQSVINIHKEIADLKTRLKRIQTKCLHPNVKKEHGANTGNYDPSADCYWTTFECPDCGKYWREDGSK